MAGSVKTVFISDDIDPVCPKLLQEAGFTVIQQSKLSEADLCEKIKCAEALIVRSGTRVTAAVLAAGAGSLKIVGRAGTGVDNIDLPAARAQGVAVVNTPAGNSLSAAELTCTMILNLARHVPAAHGTLKAGKWERKAFMGSEVSGKTLAIIGLGRIGRLVAERMQAFGMTTIGFDPIVSAEDAGRIGSGVALKSLDDIWPLADYVTLHVPLIPQTEKMINAAVLGKCRAGVRFVNVARGGILDEAAVAAGLDSGVVGGVALDVYIAEPPLAPEHRLLADHPKVIATPHLGASTKEAQVKVAEEVAQQIIEFNKGCPPSGLIK